MKTRIKSLVQLVIVGLVVFGLGVALAQAQDDRPRLRVINASLGSQNVDVYVGDTLFFRNVLYSYISDYVPLDAREHELRVRPAGVKPVDPLTSRTFSFEANQDYTMVVIGTDEKVDRDPLIITDDNKSPLAPGQTRVRMIHASIESPKVEICVDDHCEVLAHREISRGEVNGYINLDAGFYKITLRQIDAEELYFDVLPLTFEAGEVYSIFILDPKQGEIRPRIIPHADIGHYQPWPPDDLPAPWSPGDATLSPPLYPPVTGAFLSPTALSLVIIFGLALVGGCCWLAWRRFVRA